MLKATTAAATAAHIARNKHIAARAVTTLATATRAATTARVTRARTLLSIPQRRLMSSDSSAPSSSSPSSAVESLLTSPVSALDAPTDSNTLFFVCDIQETFRGKILDYEPLIATSLFLVKIANVLGIPCVTTEQKPFKPTVTELSAAIDPAQHANHSLFKKSLFSMLTPEVTALLSTQHPSRKHVVLFGIETHVCVLQTTLDLLRRGYIVHVVVDAVSSQNGVDRATALKRMEAEASRSAQADPAKGRGVLHLTTAESVLFEILRDAQHPKFKELVPAMKELSQIKKGGVAPSAAAKL